MSYIETQAKLQHKRKIRRRRDALRDQKRFITSLRYDYLERPFTHEVDRTRVLEYLGDLEHHLEYCASRYDKYLDFLRGD